MWLVDLDSTGAVTARTVPCPAPYRLERLPGTLDNLLNDSAYSVYADAWLHVTLTDHSRPYMAMERLRQRFPHVLTIDFQNTGASADALPSREHLEGMTDHEVILSFLKHVTQADATDAEQELLREGIEKVRIAAHGESI
jgi:exonuclease SbcD